MPRFCAPPLACRSPYTLLDSTAMKQSMLDKLDQLANRLVELDELLMHPDATSNMDSYRKMTREHAELGPLVALYHRYQEAGNDIATAQEMLGDPDMKDFAQEEIEAAKVTMAQLERELQTMLLPKDANDERNIFLEIRAGTGGDESALFAGDLLRIHTSACTVAVMPEADEVEDVNINPADLRIDTYRASGAGGQHINKTDSAVRITHLPTGIVVECQDDRSQHKNKAQAMKVLAARIKDVQLREQQSKEAATRKSLIGSGDRSERIRTYNFPQGRITDHRINLTLYKLDFIMDGDLTDLTNALAAEHQAELLAALGD